MIKVHSLAKMFGAKRAVDGVSFSVDRGEVLGFLGPNGAGKTTTMRIVAGFLPATAGRVRVCGADIETQAVEAKRRIGYLPEGAPSYPEMTPRSFLEFIADARGIPPASRSWICVSWIRPSRFTGPNTTAAGWRRAGWAFRF